ncbi:LppU/SCO3897 family protein [Streptomyces wuyuanensis]|uniref:LppU/SCO3897 family protein n=1 Tax=Streptomyces wuyuanensis TaxID=1196353 RepID=UPI003449023D
MSASTPSAAPQEPQFPEGQPIPGAAPAPAPAKKSKLKKFFGVVALIVVAVVVKLGIGYVFNSPVRAEAGDCVKVTGEENNPEVETKGCDDKDANYKVVKVVENTFDVNACTVGEAALAQQWDADKFVLCLDPVKK